MRSFVWGIPMQISKRKILNQQAVFFFENKIKSNQTYAIYTERRVQEKTNARFDMNRFLVVMGSFTWTAFAEKELVFSKPERKWLCQFEK